MEPGSGDVIVEGVLDISHIWQSLRTRFIINAKAYMLPPLRVDATGIFYLYQSLGCGTSCFLRVTLMVSVRRMQTKEARRVKGNH